jgi:hypothetical protein
VVVGDGFSPRMIENFFELLAQDPRNRGLPVSVIGRAGNFSLPNVDEVEPRPEAIVARMLPLLRLHAFEARLKRMLGSFDTGAASIHKRDC